MMSQERCCDVVKDRKNESHSQHIIYYIITYIDVVTLSKIEKMKAIHNSSGFIYIIVTDVVTLSKIEKMKAIHNQKRSPSFKNSDVVTLSKIEKMKATHNGKL